MLNTSVVRLSVAALALVVVAAPLPSLAAERHVSPHVGTAFEAWEAAVGPVRSAARHVEAAERGLETARQAADAAASGRDRARDRLDEHAAEAAAAERAVERALAEAREAGARRRSVAGEVEAAEHMVQARSGEFGAAVGDVREEVRIRREEGRARLSEAARRQRDADAAHDRTLVTLRTATVQRDRLLGERPVLEEAYDAATRALEPARAEVEVADAALEDRRAELARRQREHDDALAGLRGLGWQAGVLGRSGLVWPTDGTPGSRFGPRRHPITRRMRLHAGVDIPAPTGQPVVAAAAGTVTFAGDRGGYGFLVEIDHGGGRTTRYAHLAHISVRAGQRVEQAQRVGDVGSTGASTGPHLHFEVRDGGTPRDPLQWFSDAIRG